MSVLAGKVAIVTGASQGIGKATAIALAQAGADVVVNYRSHADEAERVADTCRAAGVRAQTAQADVADPDAVESMVSDALGEFGRIDIAVSNAAYSDRAPFWQIEPDGFRRTIDVTMWGAFHLLRSAAVSMMKRGGGGSIVVVSSPHAYTPVPGAMPYNMAKAAIDHMARTAATELYEHRIRVNILYPGWIDTPGERKFLPDEEIRRQAEGIPWKRLGTPEEVARGVVFFCDPASDYVTGSTLTIDGGISLPWWAKKGFRTE